MTKEPLNGSVDLLAKAMRKVFTEAVAEGVKPVKESVERLEGKVDHLGGRINDVETAMQAGFDELRPPADEKPLRRVR